MLTFDDGPDPAWTPQVLDILKHGIMFRPCFFVVGKQAEENPGHGAAECGTKGHEIGNHSLTHPDMFKLSPEAQHLQLTTTQRIIQAITGHSPPCCFARPTAAMSSRKPARRSVRMLAAGET